MLNIPKSPVRHGEDALIVDAVAIVDAARNTATAYSQQEADWCSCCGRPLQHLQGYYCSDCNHERR